MVVHALDKKNVKKLVAALLKEGTVRGPVATMNGVVLGDLSEKSELNIEYGNFKLPPKREFFPQCEAISRYDSNGVVQAEVRDEKMVVFGIRPCDAQAIGYLDKVFCDERFTDPYYKKRRDNTLIITLACDTPASTCFCSSAGGGPCSKAGADIITFNLRDSLLFEAVSVKGEAFLKKNLTLFHEPLPQELKARSQQESGSLKKLSLVPVSDVPTALKKEIDSSVWDDIAQTCLSCGACTFVCPTCHCFDLYDDKRETSGVKLRVHDACMFTAFAREASGHNPRSKPGERMRQRVMHKFSYTPEIFGDIFCVGCGRCVVSCPSNIDIRETVSRVIQ